MSGVALALASALLFGGMSVALGFSMRRSRDALVGAFATSLSGFSVCAAVANAPTRASRLRRIAKPSAIDIPPNSRAEMSANATPDTRSNLTG